MEPNTEPLKTIEPKLKQILGDVLRKQPAFNRHKDELKTDLLLIEDLEIDESDRACIIMAIEDETQENISTKNADAAKTLGDLQTLLELTGEPSEDDE